MFPSESLEESRCDERRFWDRALSCLTDKFYRSGDAGHETDYASVDNVTFRSAYSINRIVHAEKPLFVHTEDASVRRIEKIKRDVPVEWSKASQQQSYIHIFKRILNGFHETR